MTGDAANVVLVGRRNGARLAARRLHLGCELFDPDKGEHALASLSPRPDAVIAVTESAVLPAAMLRERLGMKGHGVDVARRCTNKVLMKGAIRKAGIACARFEALLKGEVDAPALVEKLGLPIVIKPAEGAGGRDTHVARTLESLPAAVARDCIAESFVNGVEMSVESLVVDGEVVFVNFTDYLEPRWANLVPAVLPDETKAQLADLNARAITALGVERGMTHLEVFLTPEGPVFGEVGARPPGGHIVKLIELAYGFDLWEALLRIELDWSVTLPARAQKFAGMRFIHPGAGRVIRVEGVDEAAALPSLQHLECKLAVGDLVQAREGSGQHCGYALLAGTREAVRDDLEALRTVLRVEVEQA